MNDWWRVSHSHDMAQWLKSQKGVVFWSAPREIALAQKYTKRVFEIFPDLTGKVSIFYLFSQAEQTGDGREIDGVCWWREAPSGMQFAIGLAVEALDNGKNYFVGLFLHELAHLTNGPHNIQHFYAYLDEMAWQYRGITGEPVFPDHRDFEPDATPGGPGRPRKEAYSVAGGSTHRRPERGCWPGRA